MSQWDALLGLISREANKDVGDRVGQYLWNLLHEEQLSDRRCLTWEKMGPCGQKLKRENPPTVAPERKVKNYLGSFPQKIHLMQESCLNSPSHPRVCGPGWVGADPQDFYN